MVDEQRLVLESGRIARVFSDPRREAIRLLQRGAELEHTLVLTYLYAGYSVLDEHFDRVVGNKQSDAGVSRTLSQVAVEEMVHLRKVNRILVELGAPPHLERPALPMRNGIYPFEVALEPLTRQSLAKYLYIEAPADGMIPQAELEEAGVEWAGRPHEPAGSIYRTLRAVLEEMTDRPPDQVASWVKLIDEIIGEGEADHFRFLRDVFRGHGDFFDSNPWGLRRVSRPLVRADPSSSHAVTASLARVANAAYWASLDVLEAVFAGRNHKTLGLVYRSLMVDVLDPVGKALAQERAGMPFDLRPARDGRTDAVSSAIAHLDAVMTTDPGPVRDALVTAREQLEAIRTGPRRVVIAGGGPAGLAAAWALSSTDLHVEIVDRGRDVGGKVETFWTGQRSTDHGMHGWWPCYVNFDAMLEDLGIPVAEALVQASGTGILAQSGALDFIATARLRLPFPAYLVRLVYRPLLTNLRAVAGSWLMLTHILAFEHGEDYAKYDHETFADLAKRTNVDEVLFDNLLAPFAHLFDYASPKELSASGLMSALQVYLLPTQEAAIPRWSHGLPHHTIFKPLRLALEKRGVVFSPSHQVMRVEADDGGVTGVVARDFSRTHRVTFARSAVPPPDGLYEVESDGTKLLVARESPPPHESGPAKLTVFQNVCPHQHGTLVIEGKSFRCTQHGAQFDHTGKKVDGVGKNDLTPEPIVEKDGMITVSCAATRNIPCAHVIAATDVRAAATLLANSSLPEAAKDLVARVNELKATSVVVIRLWFKHGTKTPRMQTIIIPKGTFAEVFFDLGEIDGSYEGEGVVVELHSSDPGGVWSPRSDTAILRGALADLKRLSPDFTEDNLQDDGYEIRRHGAVFTLYDKDSDARRPRAETPVRGLHLAGDWTKMDAAVWMMERAVVSGLRAANGVRAAIGRKPVPIRPLPEGGSWRKWWRRGARAVLWLKGKRVAPRAEPEAEPQSEV